MTIPPPLLALAAGLAQRALSPDPPAPSRARATLAAATGATGLALASSATVAFRRAGTTVEPFDPTQTTALVTTGANALTRNPMYVGLTGTLVANAIRRSSWKALLPVAGFVWVIDRFQIEREEAALAARFGADYEAYRARVPRWLGRASAPS